MKNNRICIICNNGYEYCPSCSKDRDKPTWMTMFDKEDCLNIYDTCVAYRDGNIDINEAKSKLEVLDLSRLEEFESGTKDLVKKIIGYEIVKEEKVSEDIEETVKSENAVLVEESTVEAVSEGDTLVSNGSNSTSFVKRKAKKR